LNYGDKLPADVRLTECQSFKVDNSAINGESDPQSRGSVCTDKDPMETKNLAFFSTNVVQGKISDLSKVLFKRFQIL
jgi:sodium/potassium-transporting ATPase subunit alpha